MISRKPSGDPDSDENRNWVSQIASLPPATKYESVYSDLLVNRRIRNDSNKNKPVQASQSSFIIRSRNIVLLYCVNRSFTGWRLSVESITLCPPFRNKWSVPFFLHLNPLFSSHRPHPYPHAHAQLLSSRALAKWSYVQFKIFWIFIIFGSLNKKKH